jgi:hypothetical protein
MLVVASARCRSARIPRPVTVPPTAQSSPAPTNHQTLPVGHNVPQEAPQAFADAVMSVDSFTRH